MINKQKYNNDIWLFGNKGSKTQSKIWKENGLINRFEGFI